MQQTNYTYDGKRMRQFTFRRAIDYSSSVLYPHAYTPIIHHTNPNLAHVSINKTKCTINALCFTPDGRRVITGTSTGEFTLWNTFTFNFETILQAHESPVKCLKWSPTGNYLISGDTIGQIKYFDNSMSNIQLIHAHNEAVRDLDFAPMGFKFCSCSDDSTIKIFDSKTATEERILTGHGWDVNNVAWHPIKALLASGGKDTTVRLWDPKGLDSKTLHLHKGQIYSLKWSVDGNYIITSAKDQTIKITDLRSLESYVYKVGKDVSCLIMHPHVKDLMCVCFVNGDIGFYKFFCEKPIVFVEKGHELVVWCGEYHPMGHLLATGSYDQSLRWWGKRNYRKGAETDDVPMGEDVIPGLEYF